MNTETPSLTPDSLLDDAALREALKRCPPATYYAACRFRRDGGHEHLVAVVNGVIERFVARELRPKFIRPDPTLRLREDLGLDSLTMMEAIMLAEEVLQISVSNEELSGLRTLGDVQSFVARKVTCAATADSPAGLAPA